MTAGCTAAGTRSLPAAAHAPDLYAGRRAGLPDSKRSVAGCRIASLASEDYRASQMSGRVKALALLALALLRTLWRLSWHRHIDGLARFRDNYAEDGLTPLTELDRGQMRHFGGCIACGRCDRGDAARILASNGEFRGTMGLVLAASRSMPDYRAAARGFAHLTEADLALKERLCPTRVPLRQLARFVKNNAAAARVSLPAAQGVKRIPSSFPPRAFPPRDRRGAD